MDTIAAYLIFLNLVGFLIMGEGENASMADLRKNAFFSQHFRRQYRNVGGNVCVPPQDETLVFCYRNATDPHFTDRRCHLAL